MTYNWTPPLCQASPSHEPPANRSMQRSGHLEKPVSARRCRSIYGGTNSMWPPSPIEIRVCSPTSGRADMSTELSVQEADEILAQEIRIFRMGAELLERWLGDLLAADADANIDFAERAKILADCVHALCEHSAGFAELCRRLSAPMLRAVTAVPPEPHTPRRRPR